MDQKTQSQIFDPFFTTKFTGRGLGLASVLGIIRGHKGAIKVDSELGRGTSIRILFPAVIEHASARAVQQESAADWRGSGLVLVVDDEQLVRDTVRIILEDVGFEVALASDGPQAAQILSERAEQVRVVLLDMTMPHWDGARTLAELRRIRPDLPVILTSGYDEQRATNQVTSKGLDRFIQKPYLPSALIDILREMLGEM
jgi:CheY-like chemotaxis protein